MSGGVRVLIVDDDPLVRSGLRLILGGAPDVEVVGEAGDGSQGIDQVASLRPDVVLMDIRMPVMDGIEATRRMCASPDGPRVIVLTTFSADDDVTQALGAGAGGYLLKDTAPADIVEAVVRVARGEPMLSPEVTRTLIAHVREGDDPQRRESRARFDDLTERERDVALGVGRGLSNADIADELFMSVATGKAYVSRLMVKLEAENRVQIALRVHDAGLL